MRTVISPILLVSAILLAVILWLPHARALEPNCEEPMRAPSSSYRPLWDRIATSQARRWREVFGTLRAFAYELSEYRPGDADVPVPNDRYSALYAWDLLKLSEVRLASVSTFAAGKRRLHLVNGPVLRVERDLERDWGLDVGFLDDQAMRHRQQFFSFEESGALLQRQISVHPAGRIPDAWAREFRDRTGLFRLVTFSTQNRLAAMIDSLNDDGRIELPGDLSIGESESFALDLFNLFTYMEGLGIQIAVRQNGGEARGEFLMIPKSTSSEQATTRLELLLGGEDGAAHRAVFTLGEHPVEIEILKY